jgi:hypothetical protein
LTGSEARKRVRHDPNFIYLKRFNYSLEELVERYPEGAPDRLIAQALLMTEEDVENLYNNIIAKMRRNMNVTL